MGPIRQEILSGVREPAQAQVLTQRLRDFVDLPLEAADHERAAQFYNQCRARGVQGSNTDFLVCAVAERYDLAIYTVDEDFRQFADILPISLHETTSA